MVKIVSCADSSALGVSDWFFEHYLRVEAVGPEKVNIIFAIQKVKSDYSDSGIYIPVAWYSFVTNSDSKQLHLLINKLNHLKPAPDSAVPPFHGDVIFKKPCHDVNYTLECELDIEGDPFASWKISESSDQSKMIEIYAAELLRTLLPPQFPFSLNTLPADEVSGSKPRWGRGQPLNKD
ncbi:MAG TPA: hypothetical protein PKC67_05935 [Kiritimatiellia bacterium]|nr:hypothetical protein [Kiritimatiellia bacterium]HMP33875.1 hypothetical protein [Kiritimatiellia bacterium]